MSEQLKLVDRWPEQTTRGHTIPGSRYTAKDFMTQRRASRMEADVSRVRGDQSCSIPPLHSSCVVISLSFWQ